MRSLVWDGSKASVQERAEPRSGGGMAVVRVSLAGVCNTDLEIVKGYMGFRGVLGHEFVGRVEEGSERWRGRRVVGEINFACGECELCRAGLGRHCPTRRVMGILEADGAFADYVSVPEANLHEVPDALDDEQAVFTEPLAAAFEILEQIEVGAGRSCVVLGDGKLGTLVAQVLHQSGARVLAVGKHEEKLGLLSRCGIETVLLSDWRMQPADVVVEATGSVEGFQRALEATRPRGNLVLKSTLAEASEIDLAPVVINEIQVVGSRCGPFAPALEALAAGTVQVTPLIAARFDLSDASEALEHAATRGVQKVLIDCS